MPVQVASGDRTGRPGVMLDRCVDDGAATEGWLGVPPAQRVEYGCELVGRIGARCVRGIQEPAGHPVTALFQDGLDQAVLGTEVAVERLL